VLKDDLFRNDRDDPTGVQNIVHLLLCAAVHVALCAEVTKIKAQQGIIRKKFLLCVFWWDCFCQSVVVGKALRHYTA